MSSVPRRIVVNLDDSFSRRVASEGASLLVTRYSGRPELVWFSVTQVGTPIFVKSGLSLNFPPDFFADGDLWLHNRDPQPGHSLVYSIADSKSVGLLGAPEIDRELPGQTSLVDRHTFALDSAFSQSANVVAGAAGCVIRRFTGAPDSVERAIVGPDTVLVDGVVEFVLSEWLPVQAGDALISDRPMAGVVFRNLLDQPGAILEVEYTSVEGLKSISPFQAGQTIPVPMPIAESPLPLSVNDGLVTVGTTRVQLPSVAVSPRGSVLVVADTDNVGIVMVGGANVTTMAGPGQRLVKDAAMTFNVRNLNALFAIANVAGQVLRYSVEV